MSDEDSFKKQFQVKNLWFGYDQPHKFTIPEWRWPRWAFILWRVFWCLWHIGWIIRSIQYKTSIGDGARWPIFLTSWSYTMATAQAILSLVIVLLAYRREKNSSDINEDTEMKWYMKLVWLLTEISFDAGIIVTIIYWTVLFKEFEKVVYIMTHITAVYAISDTMVTARPVRVLHFIYWGIYGVIYLLFTLVYYLAGGMGNDGKSYVYPVMTDWSQPGTVVGVAVGIVLGLGPLVQMFRYGLFKLRLWMSSRLTCGKRHGYSNGVDRGDNHMEI